MSRFPFNTNTKTGVTPLPVNPGTTPPQIPAEFQVNPNGDKLAPRDYSRKRVTNIIFDLSTTFDQTPINGEGTVFWVSSSDNTAFVRVQIDGNAAGTPATRGIACRNGFRLGGIIFSQLLITNPTAQAGLTIEIAVSRDYPDDRIDINL